MMRERSSSGDDMTGQQIRCTRSLGGLVAGAALCSFALAAPADAASYVTFDPLGSVNTFANSINDQGDVTGLYLDGVHIYAFIRKVNGAVVAFGAPTAASHTEAHGINNLGTVTGWFTDKRNHEHSFIRDSSGGFTLFDYPNYFATEAIAINDAGIIAGRYRTK